MWANSLSVKQMLDHFQFIFHASINLLCFGAHCERFSFESIQKNVKGFRTICLTSANHEHNKRVLSVFQPAELDLLEDSTRGGHIHRSISIQNFDVICAGSLQITLDDLLVFNARSIHLACDNSSHKIPNHFLKLWTKGANSRLEHLTLQFPRVDFREEELLEGLKYQHIQPNTERLFKSSGLKRTTKVIGGWDIRRLDGTQATINYGGNDNHVYFVLFVWHDHCVVNTISSYRVYFFL
ncbi:hypothetical protein CAEBREN_24223 [Caenorhabditis brenneri]|uniref:Sdz-33 F-box domain-containing protein n=1 Tax=Caenorhabditis brenneri TaxID=135651 RepID=G0N0J7_CAEBE|nr:hypothetical protein CAEBREN_24223 [Caenorhabditis brenneri]